MNGLNLEQIVSEMWDLLALVDEEFASPEKAPFDSDSAIRILRKVDRIEKIAETARFSGIRSIANRAATLAALIRDGSLPVGAQHAALLADAVSDMKELVGWVEATGAEPGSTPFDVIEQLGKSAADASPVVLETVACSNNSVLVVDGSMFFRNLLAVALERRRCSVTAVGSGPAALELIQQGESFEAVISELDLPGMSGCEFAHRMRNQPACQQTPLIALTETRGAAHRSRALSAGFDCFLTKFSAGQLYSAMDDALSQPAINDDRLCA